MKLQQIKNGQYFVYIPLGVILDLDLKVGDEFYYKVIDSRLVLIKKM